MFLNWLWALAWVWGFQGNFFGSLHHFVHEFFEIGQAGGGDDDGVAASAHVFGDAQKPSARIFLQGEDEKLSFNLDFGAFERVFLNKRFGLAKFGRAIAVAWIRLPTVR